MAPTLETVRLILRGWNDADVEACADMMLDPEVMRYQPGIPLREHAVAYAAHMQQIFEAKPYGRFVIERKDEPGFAGVMALDDIPYEVPFTPTREIGWFLPRSSWGKGYATEAARVLLRYAFDDLRWPEVVAMTPAINTPSRRVMERLGMSYDPADDFELNALPAGHELRPSVLYRMSANGS